MPALWHCCRAGLTPWQPSTHSRYCQRVSCSLLVGREQAGRQASWPSTLFSVHNCQFSATNRPIQAHRCWPALFQQGITKLPPPPPTLLWFFKKNISGNGVLCIDFTGYTLARKSLPCLLMFVFMVYVFSGGGGLDAQKPDARTMKFLFAWVGMLSGFLLAIPFLLL